ncbi:3-keto-disaccharide hydrolase [Arcticibacter svalbardensis]|uniref:3-keto-disaccharide hydrolase n=1 Tax=Arcticibacter svalbardensis TaxID=1288027 RepID=UPI0009FF0399|nr:DUF1080 domain-containing protein [Arcticibacter svalbardensis]
MNKLIFSAFIILLATSCSNKVRQAQLFNGTTLDGWYAYVQGEKHEDASTIFNVMDSMIRLNGERPGYLMSKQLYSNFELTLDYKWNTEPKYERGKGNKNSGVMYQVPVRADKLWPEGIQYQIKEGATGDFVLLDSVTLEVRGERNLPGKSVVIPRLSENERTVGEWNQLVIKSYKGKCSQYLNGKLVNEGIASSSLSGRILLQYEGSPIDFRRLIIRKL